MTAQVVQKHGRRRSWSVVLPLTLGLCLAALVLVAGTWGLPSVAATAPALAPATPGDCQVTTAVDAGPGSLRACIARSAAGSTITFQTATFPPGNPLSITLTSPLPALVTDSLTIDASTAGVILDGSGLSAPASGLLIDGADHVTIKGLHITGFPDDGVEISAGTYNVVGGSNTTPGGACSGDCNLLSGNGLSGVRIAGPATMSNTVSGNYIGTDAAGTASMGNGPASGGYGVVIEAGSSYNVVGGTTPGERNVVSGNGDLFCGPPDQARASGGGIVLRGGADHNTVRGNYVGTDSSGSSALPNAQDGVYVSDAADVRIVDNVVSGNSCNGPPPPRAGVFLSGSGCTVSDNYIGTDAAGTTALPNGWAGVWLVGSGNTVRDNLISGNNTHGIFVGGDDNTVAGNYIGTDAAGTAALPNVEGGIDFQDQADGNVVGGSRVGPGCGGDCNLISGNGSDGVVLHSWQSVGAAHNTIAGNCIGTDAACTAALPNAGDGVVLSGGSHDNLVGGPSAGQGNVVAYNDEWGVLVDGATTLQNAIHHNSIFGNGSGGILDANGGNLGMFPPLFTEVSATQARGLSVPGATIELYSDDGGQGRWFQGTAVAGGDGEFTATFGLPLTGTHVTGTATDGDGNTSGFSSPYAQRRDLLVAAIYVPQARQPLAGVMTPMVRVGNGGTAPETFDVVVAITRTADATQVYTATETAVGLGVLNYRTLSLPAWLPGGLGAYTFGVHIRAGSADDDPANDRLSRAFAVVDDRVDLWSRDNVDDDGREPSEGTTWQSPDLWVRNADDGLPEPQDPINGVTNTVYVRVRNRGTLASSAATVAVYWHPPALAIGQTWWERIDTVALPAIAPGDVYTASLSWQPQIPGLSTVPYHTCLLDVVDSAEDLAPNVWDVRSSNNVEQRNVDVVAQAASVTPRGVMGVASGSSFRVGNPYAAEQLVEVSIDARTAPPGSEVRLDLGSLFERWQRFGQDSLSGAVVVPGTSQISLAGGGQATIGGLPLAGDEQVEVLLQVYHTQAWKGSIEVGESIGGDLLGGVTVEVVNPYSVYLPVALRAGP